jgi:DTW domain-containing protein YfiP
MEQRERLAVEARVGTAVHRNVQQCSSMSSGVQLCAVVRKADMMVMKLLVVISIDSIHRLKTPWLVFTILHRSRFFTVGACKNGL